MSVRFWHAVVTSDDEGRGVMNQQQLAGTVPATTLLSAAFRARTPRGINRTGGQTTVQAVAPALVGRVMGTHTPNPRHTRCALRAYGGGLKSVPR